MTAQHREVLETRSCEGVLLRMYDAIRDQMDALVICFMIAAPMGPISIVEMERPPIREALPIEKKKSIASRNGHEHAARLFRWW